MISGYLSQPSNMSNTPFMGGSPDMMRPAGNSWNYGMWGQPTATPTPQPQPTQNNNGASPKIYTRVVHSEADIQPGDVPTDGSYCIFIRDDLKEIYIKTWGFNGYEGNTYTLLVDTPPVQNEGSDPLQEIMARLERIESYVTPVCAVGASAEPLDLKKPNKSAQNKAVKEEKADV